jgi:DNA-binding NarL/FixJ family response regulator
VLEDHVIPDKLDRGRHVCKWTEGKVRVFVLDKSPWIRIGLAQLLATEARFEVVGLSSDLGWATQVLPSTNADIIIQEVDYPYPSAVRTERALRSIAPSAKIVWFTSSTIDTDILLASVPDVACLLGKSQQPRDILDRIREIAFPPNGKCLSRKLTSTAKQSNRPRKAWSANGTPDALADWAVISTDGTSALTPREREVAGLLVEGLSLKETADRLCVSAKTIENHSMRLRKKLGVHGRISLLRLAIRAGWVRFDVE